MKQITETFKMLKEISNKEKDISRNIAGYREIISCVAGGQDVELNKKLHYDFWIYDRLYRIKGEELNFERFNVLFTVYEVMRFGEKEEYKDQIHSLTFYVNSSDSYVICQTYNKTGAILPENFVYDYLANIYDVVLDRRKKQEAEVNEYISECMQ